MALIKCPECGKEISDKAKKCIHCGCPIATEQSRARKRTIAIILIIAISIAAVIVGYSSWRHHIEAQRQATIDKANEAFERSQEIYDLYAAYKKAAAAYEDSTR